MFINKDIDLKRMGETMAGYEEQAKEALAQGERKNNILVARI